MKKIILILSLLLCLYGNKAYGVWDDDLGEVTEITIPHVNNIYRDGGASMHDTKIDVLDSVVMVRLGFGAIDKEPDPTVVERDIKNALDEAGTWVRAGSVTVVQYKNSASGYILLALSREGRSGVVCLKAAGVGNKVFLGPIPFETLQLEQKCLISESWINELELHSPTLIEGRRYTLRSINEFGEVSEETFQYSPVEGYPKTYIKTLYEPHIGDNYQLIMHSYIPDVGEMESNICYAGVDWPNLSLVELDPPGDYNLNSSGLDTLKRRYVQEDGSEFTPAQLARIESILYEFNNQGEDTYSEFMQMSGSYDPDSRVYTVNIFGLFPNYYDDIQGFCLWFNKDGYTWTGFSGNEPFNEEVRICKVEGIELTEPYVRQALKVSNIQPGLQYQLNRSGGFARIVRPKIGETDLIFDNLFAEGTYTVQVISPSYRYVNMDGSVFVDFGVQPFEIIGEELTEPYKRSIIRLSGAQTGVTYKLYRDGEFVDEKMAWSDEDEIYFDDLTLSGIYTIKGVVGESEADMLGSYTIGFDIIPFKVQGDLVNESTGTVTVLGSQSTVTYQLYCNGDYLKGIKATSDSGNIVFDNLTRNGIYTVKGVQGVNEQDMIGSYQLSILNVSKDKNYVLVHSYNGDQTRTSDISYLDEFERVLQTISINAVPQTFDKDIISYTVYDVMGRSDSISFMPYVGSGAGKYHGTVSSEQWAYYQSAFPGDIDADYAYSMKEYDNSPLGILMKQSGVGYNNSMAQHPVQYNYRLNNAADQVKKFIFNAETKTVGYSEFYAANTLTVSETATLNLSESEAVASCEFSDAAGQLVASRVKYGNGEIQTTYYVYDELGRQRYIIPAIQEAMMTVNSNYDYDDLSDYCYYNDEYDKYGHVIKQYVPGADYTLSLYDKRGRLVMSQSGNLRGDGTAENQRWAFTKYDERDRPVMTGILTGGTYQEHYDAINSMTIFGEYMGGNFHRYTNQCYPTNVSEEDVLTVSYYDDYKWKVDDTYSFSEADALGQERMHSHIFSLQTGAKTKVLGIDEDVWLTSAIYYDEKYRKIQIVSDLYPSGKEIVSNKHNWGGDVVQTKVKQTTDAGTYEYNKWFDIDNRGRLLAVRQQIVGDPRGEITIASYEYDDMGVMIAKSVHDGLDTTRYEHTLPGVQIASTSNDFSYRLGFDRGVIEGQPVRHDGLLSHVIWESSQTGTKGYTLSYDKRGQMTAADLLVQNNGVWTPTSSFAEKGISYDNNGNILSVQRTDVTGNMMHDISYNYDGNVLTSLSMGDGSTTDAFVYDANGNMTYDGNTGVGIEYNELNLPVRIFDGTNEIRYIYNAVGEKLASVTGSSLTYYRSVMVYTKSDNGPQQLVHMFQPEGIVRYNAGSTEDPYTYSYFKTDHLGSTRMVLAAVWDADQNDYTMNVEQATDYYPFGLAHELNDLGINKYLFSGKELQDVAIGSMGLLGMYDFGSRYYNPYLGRWFGIDPALQMTNPYIYCGNNPMTYVDPDGEWFFTILSGIIPGLQPFLPAAIQLDMSWMKGGFQSAAAGGSFWQGAGKGLASGAAGVGASFLTAGVGNLFGHGLGSWGTELLRAGAHGLIGGGMSTLNGNNFWQGFGTNAISSFAGSGLSALGMSNKFLPYTMGGIGALSAYGFGGDPLNGFWQGYGIGRWNHTGSGTDDDPYVLDEAVVEVQGYYVLKDMAPYNDLIGNIGVGLANDRGNYGFTKNWRLRYYSVTPTGHVFRGNQYMKVYSVAKAGKMLGKASGWVGIGLGAYEIGTTYQMEGEFGYNSQLATVELAGGSAGGWAGAYLGAKAGALAGTHVYPGPGTLIGGIVGGVIGGFAGSWGGSAAGGAVYKGVVK